MLKEGCWKQTLPWHTGQGTICDNGVFHAYPELTYIFSYPVFTSTVEIGPAWLAGRTLGSGWVIKNVTKCAPGNTQAGGHLRKAQREKLLQHAAVYDLQDVSYSCRQTAWKL